MVLVAHHPASAVGRLDMEFGSRASLVCHHSPATPWLGVAAHELAPTDGYEPPPTGLRAQAPLAICSGIQRASRPPGPRLADHTPRQGTDRGGPRRGRGARRIRHWVPPSGSLTASAQLLVRKGLTARGGSASALPGQTWSGRSGHVQTEAPNSLAVRGRYHRHRTVNWGRRPRHPAMLTTVQHKLPW